MSWFVFGPWKDPQGFNFPQTEMFQGAALLPTLFEGARLNLAFGFAIVLLMAGHILFARTHLGFKMRVAGESAAAARYAGISTAKMTWVGLVVGRRLRRACRHGRGGGPSGPADR